MKGMSERDLRAWMGSAGHVDETRLDQAIAGVDRLPRRAGGRMWLRAAVVVLAVGLVGVVASSVGRRDAGGDPSGVRPGPPAAGDPAAWVGDPRFQRCGGGDGSGVLTAFPMAHARDFRQHFPGAGRAPELGVEDSAFVVVFEGFHPFGVSGAAPPPGTTWPPRSLTPGSHDVCVMVGDDPETAQMNMYTDVDLSGYTAVLGSPSPTGPALEPGPAEVTLAQEPTADDRVLHLLVSELECHGYVSEEGRIVAEATYLPDRILVRVGVIPLPGDCPGTPPTPFDLELSEPVGDREIVFVGYGRTPGPSPIATSPVGSSSAPSMTPPPEPVAFGTLLETAPVNEVFGRPTDATPFATVSEGAGVSYLGQTALVGDVEWHLVQFIFTEVGRREWMTGWVAGTIGPEGDLVPIRLRGPRCQPGMDVTALAGRSPTDYLSCEGALSLDGYIVASDLAAPPIYTVRPAWLGMDEAYLLTISTRGGGGETGALDLQLPPGERLPVPLGTLVRVTGHFDDPRAADCRRTPQRPRFPVEPPEVQTLWCRQRFVVTSISELGGS